MKDIKVVIGSSFGDEGKGLMVDYFSSPSSNDRILNVRFNGTSQCSHTVTLKNGKEVVFSTFGAGSLRPNVDTYFTEDMIINPILVCREYSKLCPEIRERKLYRHKDCLVTLPMDMMINQFIESQREDKHGSCGIGLYETVLRNQVFERLEFEKLANMRYPVKYMQGLFDSYYSKRIEELGLELTEQERGLFIDEDILGQYMGDLYRTLFNIVSIDDNILKQYDNIVFEGGQGLLLDKDNEEYFPHLTPSNTGLTNVVKTLGSLKEEDYQLEVCYITRTYMTRHGYGVFKTECEHTSLSDTELFDNTNVSNKYQGNFRYGYFDIEEVTKAINKDLKNIKNNQAVKISLAITHLNETDNKIVTQTEKYTPQDLARVFRDKGIDISKVYLSDRKYTEHGRRYYESRDGSCEWI